jgi:ketosteroid isomerase-like protein
MLPTKEISRVAQARFAAYETGDPVSVMDVYSDDVEYWDTATPERLSGKTALAGHLGRFLARFDVCYALLEEHRLEGRDAAIVLWECAVRRRLPDGGAGKELLMQRGMNLVEVADGRVSRDESYMDLASLDRLLETA